MGVTPSKNTSLNSCYFNFTGLNRKFVGSTQGSLLKEVVSGMERTAEEISPALKEQKGN